MVFDVSFHGYGESANARVVRNSSSKITAIQFGTTSDARKIQYAYYETYGLYLKQGYCEGVYIQVRANLPTIEVVDIPDGVSFTDATVIG